MIQVSPSVLAADFSRLGEEISDVYNAGATMIHLDVMDGLFVNNISFGIPVIASVRRVCDIVFDVHLMIDKPERYIKQFVDAGADLITIHYEACEDIENTLKQIRSYGVKAALSVKPGSPVEVVYPYLSLCDMVLIMSVNPGFGGQKFIEHSLEKIKKLKSMINERGCNTLIQVDGGVNLETGKRLVDAGADVLVAGSFVFKAENPAKAIDGLKNL